MEDRFRAHPAARLYRPDGAEVAEEGAGGVIPADLPAQAIARALAAGHGFRIGGDGPAPPQGFETLTSGSTGAPRRIARSVASWTASFAINARLFGLGPGRRAAVLGGPLHSLSLYGALEGACLGAAVDVLAGVRPDRQAAALAARGVDTLYATPTQLRGLNAPLPGLRLVLVGGSKLDAALRAHLAALAPAAEVREFYGAAETSFITLADAGTPEGSVGRPYPGVEIALDAGEVWVRSPYLFTGYASDSGSAVWRDGWLSVGEMGRMENGFLWLDGRKGRMVTVADQNVFPEAIEARMEALPGITRAAVLPEPDARRGTVLYAVVLGDPAAEGTVLAEMRRLFGPLKAPRRIVWRQDWPETAAGKTDFAALVRE